MTVNHISCRRGSAALSVLTTVAAFCLLTLGGSMAVSVAAPSSTSGTTISTRTTSLGLIVVGRSRRTVYLFTKDTTNHSTCGPTCRKTWPRVTTTGAPHAGSGIKQSRLGQTPAHQVTYYGHPLYYFAGDNRTAGNTRGQGKTEFGGRWWVVSPQGKAGTGTTITVHSTPIGAAVAGPPSRPRTLYELGSDSKTRSTCNSGCAGTWPPLVTTGRPHAGAGITASLITTLVRNNGTRQVVYNGHPLYYFSGDSAAGQDNGQCITYPALWTVLTKAGRDNKTGCSATAAQCSPRPTNGVVSTATKGSLGTILVDSKGCTLYEYTRDLQNTTTSTCTSSCATAWPPMMASGAPTAQGSAQSGLLNKTSSGQVTYNGHPLYYYTGDGNSSQATGQGFNESYVPPNYYYFYAMRANGSHA